MPTLAAPGGINPAPSVTINNTAYLFFVLFGAFIVFITIRGDLPKWLGLLGLAGSPTGSTTSTNTTASNGLPSLATLPSLNGAGGSGGPNLLGAASSDASNPTTYSGDPGVDAGTWDTGGV